jgi:hypothetical protein
MDAVRETPSRRRNGRWSLAGVIDYDERFSARQIARWTAPLVLWWIVILAISIALLDPWLGGTAMATRTASPATTSPWRVMSHADALAELHACAGSQFDPRVREAPA